MWGLGSRFRVPGFGLRVPIFEFLFSRSVIFGFWVPESEIGNSGFGFRDPGLGYLEHVVVLGDAVVVVVRLNFDLAWGLGLTLRLKVQGAVMRV